MKTKRKIIRINEELCDGCGQCIPDCAEGSLKIIDGKAQLVADQLCDGLGACLGACPTGALSLIEREAEAFDEEAVEHHLKNLEKESTVSSTECPSVQLQAFPVAVQNSAKTGVQVAPEHTRANDGSALTHWPVQIRLIPAHAPFLQDAHLLVAADCTAVAVRNFQQDYLEGKTVMMGCPKFDDAEVYVQRFTEILTTCNLKSMTVLIMEVPCCSAMSAIVRQAVERSGTTIPVEQITISTRGEEIARTSW
jgi:NAD-dependent dihydropyrimidine dehydrogenase PreA subunit